MSITALAGTADANKDAIPGINMRADMNSADLAGIDETVAMNTMSIEALDKRAKDNTEAISTLDMKVDENTAGASMNAGDILAKNSQANMIEGQAMDNKDEIERQMMSIAVNSGGISVNSMDIGDLMTDLTKLEGDIDTLEGSIGSAGGGGGFKDANIATFRVDSPTNKGKKHYADAASILFTAGDDLPQLASLKCWGDATGVVGYELAYTDGVVYKRLGTRPVDGATPISPVEIIFMMGEYVKGVAGTVEDHVMSLTFTKSDGMEISCGDPTSGSAFPPAEDIYLLGVDGDFDEYLTGINFKAMPEA